MRRKSKPKTKTAACVARGKGRGKCKKLAKTRCLTASGKTKKASRCH